VALTSSRAAAAAPAPGARAGLDWGHLRFFLELARTESLTAAARRLGVDRNTVARRVTALEEELGIALFERGPQGWTCLDAGRELAELASRVEVDVFAVARHADARDRAVEGTVRLTTTMYVNLWLLAPGLARLRARHPGSVLETVADSRAFNLSRREADLAVRIGRPRDAGLLTRKLGDVAFAFYAAAGSAAARRGRVDFASDDFVCELEEQVAVSPQGRWLARVAPGRRVVARSNSTAALLAGAGAGAGVALLPRFAADLDERLARLEGPTPPAHELWLLVHRELRRTPRVAAVVAWIDELVAAARPRLQPGA
jgi:DNA-binding transcriptional LysR family regulator